MRFNHLATAIFTAVLLASAAHATVVSSTAVADDWFANNDATYTSFSVSGDPTDSLLRTFGADGTATRSALEFSLVGIAAGSTIHSAVFSVQSRQGSSVAGGIFSFWGYTGDGAISAADAVENINLLSTAPTQDIDALYSVDVTALIQSLVDASRQYAGILITVSPQGSFFGSDFVSSEGVAAGFAPSDRPDLTVDFSAAQTVPEPGGLVLFGVALAGLVASYRRRSA